MVLEGVRENSELPRVLTAGDYNAKRDLTKPWRACDAAF